MFTRNRTGNVWLQTAVLRIRWYFVGGDGQGTKAMAPDQVITDKETLRK